MAVTIWFATHSTSEDNEAGIVSGLRDSPLSSRGEEEARLVGERYGALGIAAVYAPDLQRAARTVAIALEGNQIPIHLDARLREIDYGELTGVPAPQLEPLRPAHVRTPYPGGESYEQAIERHRGAFDEMANDHRGETVLVIGCYATWMALEHLAGGHRLEEVARFERAWQPGWRYIYGRSR